MSKYRPSLNEILEKEQEMANRSKYTDLSFKPGVKLIYPKEGEKLHFCVLPTIKQRKDGSLDKSDYEPYRDDNDNFTNWVDLFTQNRNIGKKLTIVHPNFYMGLDYKDPVEMLWDEAYHDKRFYYIIRRESDGKISNNAYKEALIRRPEFKAMMNVIVPSESANMNEARVLICPQNAVFKKGWAAQQNDDQKSNMWGLADALNVKLRGIKGQPVPDQKEFDARFVCGDITNPVMEDGYGGMAVLSIAQEKRSGAISAYNISVTDLDRIEGTMEMLESRYDFRSEVIQTFEIESYLDQVILALKDGASDLLYKTFSDAGIEFQEALKRHNISSGKATAPGHRLPMSNGSGTKIAQSTTRLSRPQQAKQDEYEEEEIPMEDQPKESPLKTRVNQVRAQKATAIQEEEEDDDVPPFESEDEEEPTPPKPKSTSLKRSRISDALKGTKGE